MRSTCSSLRPPRSWSVTIKVVGLPRSACSYSHTTLTCPMSQPLRSAYISIVIAVHAARLAAKSSCGLGPWSAPPRSSGSSAVSVWWRTSTGWVNSAGPEAGVAVRRVNDRVRAREGLELEVRADRPGERVPVVDANEAVGREDRKPRILKRDQAHEHVAVRAFAAHLVRIHAGGLVAMMSV